MDAREFLPRRTFGFQDAPELGGDGKAMSFMGYDTNENVYTYNEFNSQGRRESSKGSVSGDTWTWTSSQNYGGQEINRR